MKRICSHLNAGTGMASGAIIAAAVSLIVQWTAGDSAVWAWAIPVGASAGLAIGAGMGKKGTASSSRVTLLLVLVGLTYAAGNAQAPDSLQREAMKNLDWWIGRWQGTAWNTTGQGRRDTTLMVEKIRKDLDGTVVVIEGQGKRKLATGEEGPVVHHALAVLSYNEKKNVFRWQSWRVPGGMYTETEPVVTEGGFQWGMETPRGKIRYTGRLTNDGRWVETGEFSSDGQTWHVFFGMSLTR